MASPQPLARMLPLLAPYRGQLAAAFVFLVIAAAAGLVFPAVMRFLLDAAFEQHDQQALNRIAVGLIGVFAIQGVASYIQVRLLSTITEKVIASLRGLTFSHLIRLSAAFFTERRTGELTSRLSSDLALLQSLLGTWFSELSRQILFLIGGVLMMLITNPRLTLTTVAVVPLVVGAVLIFGRSLRRASTSVQDRVAEAMGMADESFSAIRTVQSFTREDEETRRFDSVLDDLVSVAIKRANIRAVFFSLVAFVAFAGVAAVMWQGGVQVLRGQLTAGALVSFLFYALLVAAAVGQLATLFGHFQEAIGAAVRVFELLDTKPTVVDAAEPESFSQPVRGELALESVSFRYSADGPDVLHDINIRAAQGEVIALVGRSGAGKTTIASLVPRFWDVTAGRISIDGIDIRKLSLHDLREAIGMVPQEPVLFSGSIRENIAYARPSASFHEVERAARAAHALEFIERLPEGWDTRVGERGVKMSGGQRQRIAIARVFLKDPAIVILDEATSSLDTESEHFVEQALEELLEGRTTLIIAHRLSTVRRADRVIVLDQGRVVETGSHEELLSREDGIFARLYQLGA